MTISLKNLELSWENLLNRYNIDKSISNQLFLEIVEAYSNTNRFYHNLNHIKDMLAIIESQNNKFSDYHVVSLATWFHDIVYDTKRKDNEEKSAEYARGVLNDLKIPCKVTERVEKLILFTKDHLVETDDFDAQIFLDADLAILGAPEDKYRRYKEAIRKEYSWMPEGDYRSGRKGVLEGFLARKKIYFTEEMVERFEDQARLNLKKEIRTL